MPYIHVRNYEHINRAFDNWDTPYGKRVRNKAHYEQLMKEQGMISTEEAQRRGYNKCDGQRKEYELKDETRKFLYSAKTVADKNGKVRLSGKQKEFLLKRKLKENPTALKELGLT